MDRILALIAFKLRFFFGPSLRGRFGPALYIAFILLFVPTGFAIGFGLGTTIAGATPEAAIALLAAPLGGLLTLALLYSLGTGVTAHPSEFDFFMTGPLRPREYLVADLAFQIVSMVAAGGLAAAVASVAMVAAIGAPLLTAVPLTAVLLTYVFLTLMISQILVVLRARYPKAPVRTATVALIAVSLLPAISLATPASGWNLEALPFPSIAFARLGYGLLIGGAVDLGALGFALVYIGIVGLAWFAASELYIFHGIHPTLSAGLGQIDMSIRMQTQARMIGRLGGVTTRLRLRTERGGPVSLMTRLHLVRLWRDGSFLFIALLAAVMMAPSILGASVTEGSLVGTQLLMFVLTIAIATLAMNWSFYERENLWLVITSAATPGAYFRGLLLSLAIVGLAVTFLFFGIMAAFVAVPVTLVDIALPLAGSIAAAFAAAALLTRIKLKSAAFSPSVFGILIVVSMAGFLGGIAAQGLVLLVPVVAVLGEVLRASILLTYVTILAAVALWLVARLSKAFRL